jgi:hypothetical protein
MVKQLQPRERDIQLIVDTGRQLVEGRHNAGGTVTLRAGFATTVVSHPNCSKDSYVNVGSPQTANAAAALATTYVLAASVIQGGFTITHANNAQVDRTFFYTVTGG